MTMIFNDTAHDNGVRTVQIDSQAAGFPISTLAYFDPIIYTAKYLKETRFMDFVPIKKIDEGADTYNYYTGDYVGEGHFSGGRATDLPEVETNYSVEGIKLEAATTRYSYSLEELRKAQKGSINLIADKQKASYAASLQHMQRVAFLGDSVRNFNGMLTNPFVSVSNDPIDLASCTADELFDLLNEAIIKVWTDSNTIHFANKLALPPTVYALASNKRFSLGATSTLESVLDRLKASNFSKASGVDLDVVPLLELETAGTGGAPRIMAYEKTEEYLLMPQAMEWRPIAPQFTGVNVAINAEYKFGGCDIRFPRSAIYVDLTT